MASKLFSDVTALGMVWSWSHGDLLHQTVYTNGSAAVHWYTRNPGTGQWDYRHSRFLMGDTADAVAGSIYNELLIGP